jgi:poly(3-hydroxybutyrate) depolymerase
MLILLHNNMGSKEPAIRHVGRGYGIGMFYQLYELNHAAIQPFRAYADAVKLFYSNPLNPFSHTPWGRSVAGMAELFERTTRRYGKPSFDLPTAVVDWKTVPVTERIVWSRPFCKLIHFERALPAGRKKKDPKLLIVAPMSGHYATLLRGTVEAMMPHAEVYITDWADARMVPVTEGRFDLDDYIDYVIDMLHGLGPDTHVIGVCQPSVPVLAAVSIMEARGDRCAPSTMTLMGGPIDTRRNPTAVNLLAEEKGIDWFRDNVIMQVPWPDPGFGRSVYPGFLQLSGFMSMNLDRHIIAHKDFFMHLVKNDGDSAEKHRDFYDEYLAVMDLTAEFYLQTVETVFVRHDLPKGAMRHRGEPVDPGAIRNVALFTVEGENDDISGVGQTQAAHDLCVNVPADMRAHYLQPAVGHYGVFNGSRFRAEIVPRIVDFITSYGRENRPAIKPQIVRVAKG